MQKSFFLLSLVFLIIACGEDSASSKDSNDSASSDKDSVSVKEIEGMIWVPATDSVVVLGTSKSGAKANEKPEMKVVLDYGFYMGEHEVSCGEYARMVKSQGIRKLHGCDNDSLPMTNVNFYDAVLFSNALSKSLDFDTVYSYSKLDFDESNHCISMEGFVFNPDKDGFRLPTEAEWIKAASIEWNPAKSWNAGNSNYKIHKVCSAPEETSEFCDFSGNVMEWVNDWLGVFRDTTVLNYMGGTDGGSVGERVLKGGSFRDDSTAINRYIRGDVYTVTSVTTGDYVGFRLAFGKVENPVWLNKNGSAASSQMTILGSVQSIKSVVNTYNVKLAFRNDVSGNLAYVDYVNGGNTVVEVEDTVDVYHPEISPDGQRVAFCTMPEGISGKSSLYVQDLDEAGSNRVKLDVKSAAIPRWHVSVGGDTSIIYVSDAGNNKEYETWKKYNTWRVPFNNGKFGTPQKLYDGSFHGGVSDNEKLAVTGARILRVLVNNKEGTWLDGEQACNVSLSKDGTKRTLFLDFGSEAGAAFAGKSYRVHERILIADSVGKLMQAIPSPEGYTFDHTEWVSDGEKSNIVATLTNADGAHGRIVLVSVADSSIIDLVSGDELWHPCLWVKQKKKSIQIVQSSSSSETIVPGSSAQGSVETENSKKSTQIVQSSSSSETIVPESSAQGSVETENSTEIDFELDPDSAGIYYLPGGSERDVITRYKMEFLWNYKDSADVVILGSSRAYYGIDPSVFSDQFFAVNLSVPANNFAGAKFFFDEYVWPHMKKMKYLIVSLDLDRGYNTLKSSSFYTAYKNNPGYIYDEHHDFWKNGVPKDLLDVTTESFGVSRYANILKSTRGHEAKKGANGWQGEEPSVGTDSTWFDKTPELYYDNFEKLIEMIKVAKERNVYIIGVVFPMAPGFKNTGSFGHYGIRRSVAPSLIQELSDISKRYPNFILFDENKMGDHDYTDDMALDNNHLVHAGAVQMTERLDSLLKTLE